jgi:hypothetical protein
MTTKSRPRAERNQLTVKRAAELFGVSERSVYMAKKVHMQGLPELGTLVEAGQLRLSVAAWVAELDPDRQAWLIARGPEAMRAQAAAARKERRRLQICSAVPS